MFILTFRTIDSIIKENDFQQKKERKHEKTKDFYQKTLCTPADSCGSLPVAGCPKSKCIRSFQKTRCSHRFTAKTDHDYGGIKLKWKKVRNAKYYEIYWKKSKKGKFERYWRTAYLPNYNFNLEDDYYLQLGKTYYFKVRAVKERKKENSAPSNPQKQYLEDLS